MSEITEFYGKQYEDNIQLGAQQLISKFREKGIVKTGISGKSKAFGYIDKSEAREKTARHVDAVIDDTTHNRCTAYLHYDYKKLMLDPDDEVKVIADPKSSYVQNALSALRRKADERIIAALNGTKYTGENGTTTSSFNTSDYEIDADGTNTLPLAKLIETLEKFNEGDVDEQEEKYFAIGPKELSSMLGEEKLTSKDYQTLQALIPGRIASVLGFNFVLTNQLTVSSNIRQCLAWARSGLGIAVGKDITGRLDQDQQKHYAFTTYAAMMMGATRIEDAKVIRVLANEAKTG